MCTFPLFQAGEGCDRHRGSHRGADPAVRHLLLLLPVLLPGAEEEEEAGTGARAAAATAAGPTAAAAAAGIPSSPAAGLPHAAATGIPPSAVGLPPSAAGVPSHRRRRLPAAGISHRGAAVPAAEPAFLRRRCGRPSLPAAAAGPEAAAAGLQPQLLI